MPHAQLTLGESIVLGVIQGATEFLPVSSDGHLAIGAMLFRWRDMPLALSVLLHAGTFVATLATFYKQAWQLLVESLRCLRSPRRLWTEPQGKLILALVAATVPTAAIGLALEDRVEPWSGVPWIVAACLVLSAAAVASTRWVKGNDATVLSPARAFALGILQGLAVLPGLSRSGSTIAGGMHLGLKGPDSFAFSFLLSLPAVLGAIVLGLRHAEDRAELLSGPGVVGAVVSLGVGLVALRLLRHLVDKGRIWAFALYLVPLAGAVLVFGYLR